MKFQSLRIHLKYESSSSEEDSNMQEMMMQEMMRQRTPKMALFH